MASDDRDIFMVYIKCPRCRSELEIDDHELEKKGKTAIFCSNKECTFYKNPLIGLDRKEPGVYISESLL